MFEQCLGCTKRWRTDDFATYGCTDGGCNLSNGFLGLTTELEEVKETKKVDLLEVVKIQHEIIKKIISHISNDSMSYEIHYETCSDIVDIERLLEEEC